MLTLLLVWTVALGSLTIFGAGMVFPELSRKNDLIWVGVGLFYALILWANTGNIGGGLLLGQTAGISLTVWLGWQTLTQRRQLTPDDKKTPVPDWLQKVVDVVTPLWQKAYGLVAGQLGLDETPSGEAQVGTGSGSDLKAKALGFLDKLNTKPTDVTTEDTSQEGEASPVIPSNETLEVEVPEPEASSVETVVDVESPAPEQTIDTTEIDTTESVSSEAEVEEPAVSDDNHEPIEGAMSGGSDTSAEISAPEDVANDSNEAQGSVVEITPTESPAPVEEGNDSAATEPSPSDDANNVSETQDESLPVNEGQSDIQEQPEAIAEDQSHEPANEPQPEESNWPPEDSMESP